ncbi:MAG: hypothetical protein ACR2MS_01445 [Weeksellaceae bacterium]
MKNILKIVLLVLAVVLSYFIFKSVQGLVEFNKVKIQRYADAVEQLEDVANAERLYKGYHGKYTDNLDSLKQFIEQGKIYIINRTDSSGYVYDASKRIDVMKNFTVVDTIESKTSVKDSIFGSRGMQNFGYVPVNGKNVPIKLWTDFNDRVIGSDSTNIQRDYFFKAWIDKKDALGGLGEDYIARELDDETSPVKGDVIQVGSDRRPSLEGNWSSDIDVALKDRRMKAMNPNAN